MTQVPTPSNRTALIAGAVAGTTVDLSLFPLDTLKTRLQSREGFLSSGGFRGIYRGVGSALVGSAPGAAFFFLTYEWTKGILSGGTDAVATVYREEGPWRRAVNHMIAASLGEVAACSVRVPTEVVKQRAQAGQSGGSSSRALMSILAKRQTIGLTGVWCELYRGWSITILREVPFTMIQFPLWELMKARSRARDSEGKEPLALESAFYGSVAGAVAAGMTTPLDVLKTRVMLSTQREPAWRVMTDILKENGVRPFFSGLGPRVMWISIGGFIFLGSYQAVVNTVEGRGGI